MQTVNHSSSRFCVSALPRLTATAAIVLLAFARPAHAQEAIMCWPTDLPKDDPAIVLVPDDSDDDRDRGTGLWWFGLGGIPAVIDLFHGEGSHTSVQGSIGGGTNPGPGGSGSNGSWGDGFPGGNPGETPGGNPGGNPGDAGGTDTPGNPGGGGPTGGGTPGGVTTEGGSSVVPEPGVVALLAAPLVAGSVVFGLKRSRR